MVKVTFFSNLKIRRGGSKKDKKRKQLKKIFLDPSDFGRIENYLCNIYIFFLWQNNFKKCFENKIFQYSDRDRNLTKDFFNYSFTKFNNTTCKKWTFGDRTCIYKILFSLNFLKFWPEKNISTKNFLEFVFLKKKLKF